MAVPLWKDYVVNLGTGDSIQYRILLHDVEYVIYTGKAYKKPGETNITVKVNDICADYIVNVLPTLSQAEFTMLNLPLQFDVQKYASSAWTTVASPTFLNDWSYDYGYNPATMGMARPINGRVDARMPIVWTGFNVSEVTARIYYHGGSSSLVIIPVEISNDFNDDFNDDFSHSVRSAGSGTAVFFPSEWEDVEKIVINNVTYYAVDSCSRYALYYLNAYGGWDCFLIEGNTLEADSLTRHTMEMEYDNRSIENRGIRNYVNEITKGFTFHSGWLLGEQGERMHHLINSPNVYMYDMVLQQMIPVTIPSTTCEYKNYKNNGNRLVDYTIQVEVAQNRIRR